MQQHQQQSHQYDQQVRGRQTQIPKRFEYQLKFNKNIPTTAPTSRNASRNASLSRPRSQHRLTNLLPQLTNEPNQLARLRRENSNASRTSSKRTTSPCPSEILLLRTKSNNNIYYNGPAATGTASGDSKFPKVYQERNVSETRYPNYVYSNQDNNQQYQQLQARLNNYHMNGANHNNNNYITSNNPYVPSGWATKSRQSSVHRTVTTVSNQQHHQERQQQLEQGTNSRTSPTSPISPLNPQHPQHSQTRRKSIAIAITKPSNLSNNTTMNNNSDNRKNVGLDSSVEKINHLYNNRGNSTQSITPSTGWKNQPRSPKKRGRVGWRGIESRSQKHGETVNSESIPLRSSVHTSEDSSSASSFSGSGSASRDGLDQQSTRYMSDNSSIGILHERIKTGNDKNENNDEFDEDDELAVRALPVSGILDDGLVNSNDTFYFDAIDDDKFNQQLKSESAVNHKNIKEQQEDMDDALNSKPLRSQFRQNAIRELGYGYGNGQATDWRSLLNDDGNANDNNTTLNFNEPILDNSLNLLIESDGIHFNNKAKKTIDLNSITATTASEKIQYEEIYKDYKNLKLFGKKPMMNSIERVIKIRSRTENQQMTGQPYGGRSGVIQEVDDYYPSNSTVATSLLAVDARMSQTRNMLSFPFGGGAGGYGKRVENFYGSGGDGGGVITDAKNKQSKGKSGVQGGGDDGKKDLSSFFDKNGKFKFDVGEKIANEMWNLACGGVTKT
ncbi:unnamed protein product [Ambrosiozyma monospora]|uniref:Unnamed protein product n=1 Tax=Ambrosiozyma monospora TaxID=43982 RepID=A0A9W7DLB3_AMBMO|nr:unnamed protein product [Ambrosiozyma monospora]